MIKGGYHLARVRPNIDITGNVAYEAHDLLFDWHRFEIPRGACTIKSFNMVVPGTNGACVTGIDMDLYFATTVNGAAPPSLGTVNAVVNDGAGKIAFAGARNHIIAHRLIDASVMENIDTYTASYNMWDTLASDGTKVNDIDIVLEGDPNYLGTTAGYQSVWIAAITLGAADFGTAVTLNQAGHQAVSTTAVDLIVTGTDADDVFSIGDELISFVAANGTVPKLIGEVTSIPDADSIVVDAVAEAFNHTTEICMRAPIRFNFGLEY